MYTHVLCKQKKTNDSEKKNKMTLDKIILDAKDWTKKEQIEFCRFISQNIIIAIRSINLDVDTTDKEKLDAIRWINEFHHRIDNVKFDIENVIDNRDKIELIGKHATHYAKQNKVTRNEISAVLQFSYDSMVLKIEKKNKKETNLDDSIYDLIVNEYFRKRIGMYIQGNKISILRGFMDGYFYAITAMDIHLRESEPKFELFQDWVSNLLLGHRSAVGWENIILRECDGDEKESTNLFFKLYDDFKNQKEVKIM